LLRSYGAEAMSIRTRAGPHSFGDFIELVPEDQKADLIDGVIYMASPENIEHNELESWLLTLLRVYIEQRRLGQITVSRVAYRLATHVAPEPDIAFVAASRAHLLKGGYVDGPPDLAVEFVSPESVERDYELKRARYEQAGVREYWIIDPDEKRATFLVLGPDGKFAESPPVDDRFHSRVLPGFSLDTRWLWQRPLPETLPIVHALLAE
jgi:Uma2 family endonuclease